MDDLTCDELETLRPRRGGDPRGQVSAFAKIGASTPDPRQAAQHGCPRAGNDRAAAEKGKIEERPL